MRFTRMFSAVEATAHCDLPCGVYDPAQARIEAESVKAIQEKYQANEDPVFRTRAILIKEQRADLVNRHPWVLWTDYFKPPHFEKYPQLHELFNKATKQAGASGAKGSMDPAEGQKLLDYIAEIDKIFWETKAAAAGLPQHGNGRRALRSPAVAVPGVRRRGGPDGHRVRRDVAGARGDARHGGSLHGDRRPQPRHTRRPGGRPGLHVGHRPARGRGRDRPGRPAAHQRGG